jgi:phosphatidylethanolamine/phosphatidyl-N-methylethanolamine N-methyltransferase
LGYTTFLRGFLDDPLAVSAPTPSGPALSTRLAAEMDPSVPGSVIELGPGTGVVTRALLERGVAADRLILIENSGYFCDLLRRKFPAARVIMGDALRFEENLDSGEQVAGIVSGIPLLNFELGQRRSLIERALRRQGPAGRFVQLSYGWRPAVPPGPRLHVKRAAVWRNFPPAFIWTYSVSSAV